MVSIRARGCNLCFLLVGLGFRIDWVWGCVWPQESIFVSCIRARESIFKVFRVRICVWGPAGPQESILCFSNWDREFIFCFLGLGSGFGGALGARSQFIVFLLVLGIDCMVLRVRVRVWGARWASGVNSRVLHLGL